LTAVEPTDDITLIGQHHALHAIKFKQLIMWKSLLLAKTTKCKTASIFQTKLVSQMMIKTGQNKLYKNYTCFNDAIQSFATLNCPTPMSELKEDEMEKLFLTTGQMRMSASKNTKIISQFLEIVG